MAKTPSSPVATYSELSRIENLINQAESVDDLRKLVVKDGPKIGYKAFCYILGGKMSPEAMKPDEACVAAFTLEQQGQDNEAAVIYKKVVEFYPDHPIAKEKISA
jgi:hypothetical protein